MADTLYDIDHFTPFVDGLDHPEGVTWGPDGYVYAGGEAGQIYRVDLQEENYEEIANTGGFMLGLCLDADANVYACDIGNQAVMRVTQSGKVSTYSKGTPERPMVSPNYPVFDPQGNLYVSDSGDWKEDNGCLFRVRPGGETEVVSDELLEFPNGLALSPDGSELYVALSLLPGVAKVALSDDGTVGSPEPVAELPRTVPDGLAFDEDGNLFVSCYSPSRIYRLAPDGALEIVGEDWQSAVLAAPTNVTFAGPDRRSLVIGSLARWHLTRAQMPTPGVPLNYPSL